MERAIEISVDSLSPTINWKTLRVQEFPLPLIEEQKRIAEILWAADEALEKYELTEIQLEKLTRIQCNRLFEDKTCLVKIQDLVDKGILYPPQDGNHGNDHPKAKDYVESGIPFIMASNLSNHKVDTETCKFLPKSLADKLRIGFSVEGDILLSHKGTVGEVAIVPPLKTPYVMLTPQVTYYRIKDPARLTPTFLFFIFISDKFQRILQRFSAQSTRSYVGITAQKELSIPLPDIYKQNCAVAQLEKIFAEKEVIEKHQNRVKQVGAVFLNMISRNNVHAQ